MRSAGTSLPARTPFVSATVSEVSSWFSRYLGSDGSGDCTVLHFTGRSPTQFGKSRKSGRAPWIPTLPAKGFGILCGNRTTEATPISPLRRREPRLLVNELSFVYTGTGRCLLWEPWLHFLLLSFFGAR